MVIVVRESDLELIELKIPRKTFLFGSLAAFKLPHSFTLELPSFDC